MALSYLYATKDDVKKHLLGLDVSDIPDSLDAAITSKYIPWAQRDIDSFCGQNFDLTTVEELYDGSGSDVLVLRKRPIREILKCVLYVIPSVQWVEFRRWFYHSTTSRTGIQIARSGGVQPNTPNTDFPPYIFPTGLGFSNEDSNPINQTGNFTDTEQRYGESDLFVDMESAQLMIPPRILFMDSMATPFWNYTWLHQRRNVKVKYTYGYSDPTLPDPLTGSLLGNLPREITDATAAWACQYILLDKAVTMGAGAKSLSIDGVSRNFGELPYEGVIKMLKDNGARLAGRYKTLGI